MKSSYKDNYFKSTIDLMERVSSVVCGYLKSLTDSITPGVMNLPQIGSSEPDERDRVEAGKGKDESVSSSLTTTGGIPQGCMLSPYLFNIYICMISLELSIIRVR